MQKRQKRRHPVGCLFFIGRSGGIRTRGLLVPNQTRYQAALHLGKKNGANEGTRTPDLLITNQLLYRLSYIGTLRIVSAKQYSMTASKSQTLFTVDLRPPLPRPFGPKPNVPRSTLCIKKTPAKGRFDQVSGPKGFSNMANVPSTVPCSVHMGEKAAVDAAQHIAFDADLHGVPHLFSSNRLSSFSTCSRAADAP